MSKNQEKRLYPYFNSKGKVKNCNLQIFNRKKYTKIENIF